MVSISKIYLNFFIAFIYFSYSYRNQQKQDNLCIAQINYKPSFYNRNKLSGFREMRKNIQYTPSTAPKKSVQFQSQIKSENQTGIFSPSNRRRSHKIDSKMSNLRGTLDDLISMVSSKGAVQKNAFQKVWETNSQLADQLSSAQYQMSTTVSNLQKNYFKTSAQSELSKASHLEDEEQIRLKAQLVQEMRSTNDLMDQIRSLQREQSYLRQNQSASNDEDQIENQQLRKQLNRLNSQRIYKLSDLMREFNDLKEQNQNLRQDTIRMLKKSSSKQYLQPNYIY